MVKYKIPIKYLQEFKDRGYNITQIEADWFEIEVYTPSDELTKYEKEGYPKEIKPKKKSMK